MDCSSLGLCLIDDKPFPCVHRATDVSKLCFSVELRVDKEKPVVIFLLLDLNESQEGRMEDNSKFNKISHLHALTTSNSDIDISTFWSGETWSLQ